MNYVTNYKNRYVVNMFINDLIFWIYLITHIFNCSLVISNFIFSFIIIIVHGMLNNFEINTFCKNNCYLVAVVCDKFLVTMIIIIIISKHGLVLYFCCKFYVIMIQIVFNFCAFLFAYACISDKKSLILKTLSNYKLLV